MNRWNRLTFVMAFLVVANVLILLATVWNATTPMPPTGGSAFRIHRTWEHYTDGRVFEVLTNSEMVTRIQVRAADLEGIARVWWPVLLSLVIGLYALLFTSAA